MMFSLESVLFVYVAMGAAQQRGNAFFVGSIARQRPVSNNRKVFSLDSVPRTFCNGKIIECWRGPAANLLNCTEAVQVTKTNDRPNL
jgi:hypothetical protein